MKIDMMYDISDVNDDSNLLGYDAALLGEWFLITSEVEDTKSICSVGNHSPNNTASHPWILEQFRT